MKQWKFIGEKQMFTAGRWYNPGEIIENESKPNTLFEEVKETKKVKGE